MNLPQLSRLFLVISVGVKPILLAQKRYTKRWAWEKTSLHGSLIASLNMTSPLGTITQSIKQFPQIWGSPNGAAYSKIKHSGRPGKDYLLSVGMAKELAMIERNDQGRAIRRYFIQCEEELQRSVPEIAARYRRQLKARLSAANNFKPMCDALNMARAEMGKTTQQHHYTNESNMISRIVLGGLTAKQWARINGYSGEPRDHMNAEQLEHLSYLESTNITLIDMGMEYEQRKGELTRLSQRWLAKRLEVVNV